MASKWIEKLKNAQKTCIIQDGKRKVHYTFDDGGEMAEDYDLKSHELIVRKWRIRTTLGGEGKWVCEVGEQLTVAHNLDNDGFVESSSNPICIRKDTKTCFQWRIRNLPYPKDNYDVMVDGEDIVIRTKNKKYYKKVTIPDMERAGASLNQSQLTIAHSNNTLIVSYKKPSEILHMEKLVLNELSKIEASKDGDVDCKQS